MIHFTAPKVAKAKGKTASWRAIHAAADRDVPAFRAAFSDALASLNSVINRDALIAALASQGAIAIDNLPWEVMRWNLEQTFAALLVDTMRSGGGAAIASTVSADGRAHKEVPSVTASRVAKWTSFVTEVTKSTPAKWVRVGPGVYETAEAIEGVFYRIERDGKLWRLVIRVSQTPIGQFESLTAAQSALPKAAPIGNLVARFDVKNPAAIRFADRHAAQLVQDVTAETRAALRQIVTDAQTRGVDVRGQAARIADELRSNLGLNRQQARTLGRLQARLEEQGLNGRVLTQRVGELRERMILQRSTTIARHETLLAANAGQQDLWQQARAGGLIDPTTKRGWITTPDSRLCEVCRPMHGQVRGMDEEFESPTDGTRALHPPIHVQCRCAVVLVIE